MNQNSKILIFGGTGLLGGAVKRLLQKRGFSKLQTPRSKDVNLLDRNTLTTYLETTQPEYIFMCAGLVGGILGNKNHQADFLYHNASMILNLLESLRNLKLRPKVLYPGSTCIYPNTFQRPISEVDFLSDKLEETNIGYAIAKITGIIACQKYSEQYNIPAICCMPTSLYGIGDNYDLENSHFIAALIKKFIVAKKRAAKKIEFWGTGRPRREALFNEDCADALIYLMQNYHDSDLINIGIGFDYSIQEYVEMMKNIVGFEGDIIWDKTKPDGTFRKQIDITKLKSIYPDYEPIDFATGVQRVIADENEMKRILES